MVANKRKKDRQKTAARRLPGDFGRIGVNENDGHFLSRNWMHRPPDLLGLREGLREALRRISMEYMIAGLISLGLFAYLIYALLKPEHF